MTLYIDAETMLQMVAAHGKIFPVFLDEVGKVAGKFLAKEVSSKDQTIDQIQIQFKVVGRAIFIVALDNVSDTSAIGLLKRLDPNNIEMRNKKANESRKYIIALASGEIKPVFEQMAPSQKKEKLKKQKLSKSISENINDYKSPFEGPRLVPPPEEIDRAGLVNEDNLKKIAEEKKELLSSNFNILVARSMLDRGRLELVLKTLTEIQLRKVATKLDRHNPSIKLEAPPWLILHIVALCSSAIEATGPSKAKR